MDETDSVGPSFLFTMLLKLEQSRVVFALGFILIFLVSGYLLSDSLFFNQLIRSNAISIPEEAFAFVEQNTRPATKDVKSISGLTPRYMLTQRKILYCDEGAIATSDYRS